MADTVTPRVYLDVKSLDDLLLKQWVTPAIIAESTEYVESFAISLGVDVSTIATPTPYTIARMAELFCYMTAAQKKATFTTGKDAGNDSFALKYEMYRQLLANTEKSITALTFTNGVKAKPRRFPRSISISRG